MTFARGIQLARKTLIQRIISKGNLQVSVLLIDIFDFLFQKAICFSFSKISRNKLKCKQGSYTLLY